MPPKNVITKYWPTVVGEFYNPEHDQLGDTTTLADPTVVESLVENRRNK